MARYNPDQQKELCQDKYDCWFGEHPTLAGLKAYGTNAPVSWLIPQLLDLSEFCGCRDKLTGRMIEDLAGIIASEWFYLKVSELMLFFHWFKAGRYGRFYGSVDPLVIVTSLRVFMAERGDAISRMEQQERERRMEQHRANAVTYDEYLELRKNDDGKG